MPPQHNPGCAPVSEEIEVLPEAPVVPLNERTFATSNYKKLYLGSKVPDFQHEVLSAVHNVSSLYAIRLNPTQDQGEVMKHVTKFMEKIQTDAFQNIDELEKDVSSTAEYLWTSGKTHQVFNNRELCSILNAVIRDDVEQEVEAAVAFIRGLNSRRIVRMKGASLNEQAFPLNGKTWRGGGFNDEHRPFFNRLKRQKYRVPGFLATSNDKMVAFEFAFKADKTKPCVMWCIKFDPKGKHNHKFRVKHMTFVSKSLIPGEGEYLFAPYSVFKLLSIKWSAELSEPHEITIRPALDNKIEEEHLPLTPWY